MSAFARRTLESPHHGLGLSCPVCRYPVILHSIHFGRRNVWVCPDEHAFHERSLPGGELYRRVD